jgi:uncharacterized damage-inducible protein DinB
MGWKWKKEEYDMFQTVNGFLQTWEHEAGLTQKIMDALTDESLSQEVTLQDRTLGRLAWHVATAIHEMAKFAGLEFAGLDAATVPSSAKAIAEGYRQGNQSFVQAVKTQWSDDSLKQVNDFFGQKLPNGLFLMMLINHQIHHRGQMTILMRQAGLKVPGVYGPAREEWSAIGMEAPAI